MTLCVCVYGRLSLFSHMLARAITRSVSNQNYPETREVKLVHWMLAQPGFGYDFVMQIHRWRAAGCSLALSLGGNQKNPHPCALLPCLLLVWLYVQHRK